MSKSILITFTPLLLLVALAVFGFLFSALCKFVTPKDPFWPYAEKPGLALELADSLEFVDKVLGKESDDIGNANRKAARRFQFLDFPFIGFYVAFFLSVPWARTGLSGGWVVIVAFAFLTGILDVIEDLQILRLLRRVKGSSAKFFGQTKWLFYFITLAVEGGLLFFEAGTSPVRATVGKLIGAAVIGIGAGGIISSTKGSFEGI